MAYSKDKFIELLRGKIDSRERWEQVTREAGLPAWNWPTCNWGLPRIASYMCYRDMVIGDIAHIPEAQRWWIERETARKRLGVYPEPTEVMEQVTESFHLATHFIHISRDDPNMVAYTPSIEYGLADRQVKMAFGKLLRKLLLLATDTHIQALEASHRSELDPTFKVARTTQEVEHVYRNMASDNGCMRHAPAQFDLPDHIHPSHVYSYPGLGVAYTEVEGRILSRSVIYDNPDNPEDKRYVRIYGDGALRRKLERAGYKPSHLQGVKIRALHLATLVPGNDKWRPDSFVVPYLDGPNGNQDTRAGSYAYHIQGEDCLRLTDDMGAERLHAMGFKVPRCKATGAVQRITSIPMEKLTFTCAFSGQTFNSMDVAPVLVYHEGQIKRASKDALPPELRERITAYTIHDGQKAAVLVSRADLALTFVDLTWGIYWLDTQENRKANGYVLLDVATYGEKQWERQELCVPDNADAPTTYFRRVDCTLVFDATGEQTWMPQAKLNELRTANPKAYKNVAPHGSTKAVSHVNNPNLVTTLGKRVCVKGWHAVRQLYDGTWDYEQNCHAIAVMAHTFYWSDKQRVTAVTARVPEAQWAQKIDEHMPLVECKLMPASERQYLINDYLQSWLRRGIDAVHFFLKGEMLFRGQRYADTGTVPQMRAAVTKLQAMSDQDVIDMLNADMLPYARAWQYNAEILIRLFDARLAEAAAFDAAQAAPAEPVAPLTPDLDTLLTITAEHIREERFAHAA